MTGRISWSPGTRPQRINQTPKLSTLDIYAIHVLAQGSVPSFVTLPDGVKDQLTAATFFLP